MCDLWHITLQPTMLHFRNFVFILLKELLTWVIDQPWCNGKVGSGGISYDGMTAAQLGAYDTRGVVKALAFIFSPVNLYEDLCMPGGIRCCGFLDSYRHFTYCTERNVPVENVELPLKVKVLNKVALDGVAPVQDEEADMIKAIAEHTKNWDMTAQLQNVFFSTDTVVAFDGAQYTCDSVGTTVEVLNRIRRSRIPVYSYAGYYDSGSIRSATRVHSILAGNNNVGEVNEGNVHNKLTVGPWNHGVRNNGSPFSPSHEPSFDLFSDLKRFFDFHM